MKLGTAQIIQGNALQLPLPDSSVDLVCTSPPYFGLRSYQDAGIHYDGQIGSEATPAEFLDALLAATREMVRVLKPSGSIFVNLGDKYAGSGGGGEGSSDGLLGRASRPARRASSIPTKSLMGIPWRYAIACIDELGLILRAEIIWSKPNGLPESVTDRVRRSHEQWFHFVRQPRYFSAVDEIREPSLYPDDTRHLRGGRRSINPDGTNGSGNTSTCNPLGKLPGSVWTIPTQPLTVPPELGVDHFAAYPMEWPRRIIMGWTPHGICRGCGEGKRPLVLKTSHVTQIAATAMHKYHQNYGWDEDRKATTATITGYTCGCTPAAILDSQGAGPFESVANGVETPPPLLPAATPAVVLDPFGGTGTTALVAKALGRTGITIDLSSDYCRLAQWRCNDPRELAAALQVEKPDPVHPDQLDLFSGIE